LEGSWKCQNASTLKVSEAHGDQSNKRHDTSTALQNQGKCAPRKFSWTLGCDPICEKELQPSAKTIDIVEQTKKISRKT